MSIKPNLILLHGALGAKEQLVPLEKLLEKHFMVYRLDFSGHGGQAFGHEFSITRFAKELQDFILTNELSKPNIFGYSMGGYVALCLAKTNAEIINKIYTLGTKFNWTPETASHEVKMLNPEKIEKKVPDFAAALANRHAPNDWKEVLLQTKKMMLNLGKKNAILPNEFKQIENQVIIGIGNKDSMVSVEESENVANKLPNGKLNTFENFKHPIEQIDIQILSNALRNFILQ